MNCPVERPFQIIVGDSWVCSNTESLPEGAGDVIVDLGPFEDPTVGDGNTSEPGASGPSDGPAPAGAGDSDDDEPEDDDDEPEDDDD